MRNTLTWQRTKTGGIIMQTPDLILETASFHGGSPLQLERLIKHAHDLVYSGTKGIKFHAIAADKLATKDFFAYPIYQELQISTEAWCSLIAAAQPLDVWLEMADAHCGDVLAASRDRVTGIKFQPSMVENTEVLASIRAAKPETLRMILNVSGLSIEQIETCLDRVAASGLRPENITLQVGFQGYPTAVEDTMLNKLAVVRAAFPEYRMGFADHVSAADPYARIVPAVATAMGCALIEKHVCIARSNTKYDAYSALEMSEVVEMVGHLEKTAAAFAPVFISASEQRYLAESIQQPALAVDMSAGTLVAAEEVVFRRQAAPVLSLADIRHEQARARVLAEDITAGRGVQRKDFRDANISVVVACRMKSTRLKFKPKIEIDGVPALDRCLENCLRISRAQRVILATSTVEQDDPLITHTLSGRVGCLRGDPEDVMLRYLDAADQEGIDIIVRVTADNPVTSPEIADLLIESHLRTGADFTRAKEEAVGTGVHIINVQAMRKVIRVLGAAPMSEYMNWYFETNPSHFKLNIVDLPSELVRPYRLTMDYQADVDMLMALFAELGQRGLEPYTKNVFKVLDERPDIAAMNADEVIIYKADEELISRLQKETRFPSCVDT
ncbi:N-acetylneuraminate synthase family protein [Cognatiyoonia sp. IB215446]|uniref:cytidylyltransferase domain-containing protein n=1 Tax=Cognatiyoonia sp. IB215446 TaxID=3097355 RepID=UPI002A165539|nr:N-acetylneuraminate synthase family protein [Cognatiyoonia sp. IB215446]MDX8349444.1 N-acetylneuraminate synthase family protein [Cognatiyoonia sp. IB215446]